MFRARRKLVVRYVMLKLAVSFYLFLQSISLCAQSDKSYFETNYKFGVSLGRPILLGFYSSIPVYDLTPDNDVDRGLFLSNTIGINLWKVGLEYGYKTSTYSLVHSGGNFVAMIAYQRIYNQVYFKKNYGDYLGGEVTVGLLVFAIKYGIYSCIEDDSRNGEIVHSLILSFGY